MKAIAILICCYIYTANITDSSSEQYLQKELGTELGIFTKQDQWYTPFLPLIGKWQINGKEQYEGWQFDKEKEEFLGKSYKLVDGNKQVSETITIRKKGDKIIYTPVVPTQNDGRAIDFILNAEVRDKFSFENPDHDFPKKIQYKLIDANTMEVAVLGEDDKGFKLKLTK